MKRNAIFVFALLLATTSLFAATGSADAKARIGAPLVITAGDTLSFGTIFVTNQTAGGTVTVGWDGALTTAGAGATLLTSADVSTDTTWAPAADDPALGSFTVQGPPTSQLMYEVDVEPSVLVFAGTCPTGYSCADMALAPVVVDPSVATGSGTTTFKVGGTLTVAGTQGEGLYSGTYTITANFQ